MRLFFDFWFLESVVLMANTGRLLSIMTCNLHVSYPEDAYHTPNQSRAIIRAYTGNMRDFVEAI
jgi:hypothetical protein